MAGLVVYGDSQSGNCLKIKYTAAHLGIPYRWIETSVLKGETRLPDFLTLNPAGQVPLAVLENGQALAQSGAIILHLAEGSALIPEDAYARAVMFQWMFWEQYSHEPVIAVRRYHKYYLNKPDAAIDPGLLPRGHAVLGLMDQYLASRAYFAGDALSLADIALLAYTRLAPDGGFDLAAYAHLRRWIRQVETALRLPPASEGEAAA